MKRKELYQKTVDILVQAYFNDTLQPSNTCGCAVGNLVAANMGYRYNEKNIWVGIDDDKKDWSDVFYTCRYEQTKFPENYTGLPKIQIDSTGYSWQELAQIEYAFETASYIDDKMFNGLMAVIEVLDRIHENTDPVRFTN